MNNDTLAGEEKKKKPAILGNLVIGVLLILVGILFLAGQLFGAIFQIDLGDFTWPFFVIIPGIALFLIAMGMEVNAGRGLAIFGSMVTMVGLLLFVQNTTDLWATWAYAWALVAPTSIGLSDMVYGTLRGRQDWAQSGVKAATVGIGIFLVGAIFFELILNISGIFGESIRRILFPLLLIGLGLVLILGNFMRRRR